jgi:hypothetical protein
MFQLFFTRYEYYIYFFRSLLKYFHTYLFSFSRLEKNFQTARYFKIKYNILFEFNI